MSTSRVSAGVLNRGDTAPSAPVTNSPDATKGARNEVFISYAHADANLATGIYTKLTERGVRAFIDQQSLSPGDLGAQDLQLALDRASIVLFVLSPEFVASLWPMRELYSLLRRASLAETQGQLTPIFISVFYRLSVHDLRDSNLHTREDISNVLIQGGFFDRVARGEDTITGWHSALVELAKFTGIENEEGAGNFNSLEHAKLQDDLAERIASAVLEVIERLRSIQRKAPDPRIIQAALAQGKDKLDTVRLMVVGGPTKGKTSTIASLRGETFDEERQSTQGIDLNVYHLVVGRRHVSNGESEYLEQKDKFQARFRLFAARSLLADGDEVEQDHLSGAASGNSTSSLAQAEIDVGSTRQSVMQLVADAAMDSEEYQSSDIAGLTLRCWDFGGQREYQVAHELFISPRSILMLVFDLSKLEGENTRDEELRELSHWLQTLFALTAEEDIEQTAKSILIAGTRRDSCKHPEKVEEYLDILRQGCMDNLDEVVSRTLMLDRVCALAIENRTAVEDPEGSGLDELERHLEKAATRIIEESTEVPLRWLAFLESLRQEEDLGGLFLTREALQNRMDGFSFPLVDVDRSDELKAMFLYFRDLGEVVMFEISRSDLSVANEDFVVFLHPEKVLRALKVIVAPERIRKRGIFGEDRKRICQGLLTKRTLKDKWESMDGLGSEDDRKILADLFTSMDLFVKLADDLIGVPALLSSGWEGWGWLSAGKNKKEVAGVTLFENYIPFGLIGTLVARLHRTIGEEQTDVKYVRSNAVLLTSGLRDGGAPVTQLFAGFDKQRRELHWKVRSDEYKFGVLFKCLVEFDAYMSERVNCTLCPSRHFLVADCPRGCANMGFRLMFPLQPIRNVISDTRSQSMPRPSTGFGLLFPLQSIRNIITKMRDQGLSHASEQDSLDLADISERCGKALCDNANCRCAYEYKQALEASEASATPGELRQGNPDSYVVFVSHAGAHQDKEWAEYLARVLESKTPSLRTFVDRPELTGSWESAPDLMRKAMESASVGVFITSPEHFCRKWTMRELRTFLDRNARAKGYAEGKRIIIYPIFYRLSFSEASDADLFKNPNYSRIFGSAGFFDPERQAECSTKQAVEAMKQLCTFSGLEKKLPALHTWSRSRDEERYQRLQAQRAGVGNGDDPDQELRGVTVEEFFEFAADRIASAYHKSRL